MILLKDLFFLVVIYFLAGTLRYFFSNKIIRVLFEPILANEPIGGTPRFCYLEPVSYVLIFVIGFFMYQLWHKNRRIYIITIIGIVLSYLTTMFGIIGCLCLWR
jgi:hypothetical protein